MNFCLKYNDLSRKSEDPIVWLDVTDFIQYIEGGNVAVSGIQRVIANLIKKRLYSRYKVIPVIFDFEKKLLFSLDINLLDKLVDILQSDNNDALDFNFIKKINNYKKIADIRVGDILVIAGAFWIYNNFNFFMKLRNKKIKIALFVHDLIQLSFPEYVSDDVNIKFCSSFLDMLSVATLILTNSNYVKNEVENFIKETLKLDLPVYSIQLPTELPLIESKLPDKEFLDKISNKKFILCVSTLEIRKNHIYLIKIWERLEKELGDKLPNLVFVGKWGWKTENLKSYIKSNRLEEKWLIIINNSSDLELSYLYKKSFFTAYPSFAEGWGLPVGESLSYKKACVASNKTSIPEVGENFVEYFDPYNIENGYLLIKKLILNPVLILKIEKKIIEQFKPRTWDTYCQNFYNKIKDNIETITEFSVNGNYVYSSKNHYFFNSKDLLSSIQNGFKSSFSARTTLQSGWKLNNQNECWADEEICSIRIPTNLPYKTTVLVYLRLNCNHSQKVIIGCEKFKYKYTLCENSIFIKFKAIVSENNDIYIYMYIPRNKKSNQSLENGFFEILEIGFLENDDFYSRMDFLEYFTIKNSMSSKFETEKKYDIDLLYSLIEEKHDFFNKRIYLFFARYYARKKKYKAAEKFYAKILKNNLYQEDILIQYGHMLKEQGKLKIATGAYELALQLESKDQHLQDYISTLKRLIKN